MRERLIINPLYKDIVRFVETSDETGGMYSQFEVTLMPGGGTPPHIHTSFTETFTALKGVLGLKLKREKILLTPGESYVVLKNEVHNFYNPGNKPVTFKLKFSPGHRGMENTLRIAYGLASDGLTNRDGIPRNILQAALIMEMSNSYPTGIVSIFRPALQFLARKARRNGIEEKLLQKYCSEF